MDQKIRQLLNQLSPKPSRSKLEPHLDIIRELRQKRLTYEEIAQFLAENLNLTVAPSTIYAFMHVRARRCQQSAAAAPPTNDQNPPPARPNDVAAHIQAVKKRVALSLQSQPEKPRFEYVEGQPLTLLPDRKD
jgi:IS30 family transposase